MAVNEQGRAGPCTVPHAGPDRQSPRRPLYQPGRLPRALGVIEGISSDSRLLGTVVTYLPVRKPLALSGCVGILAPSLA